ncbi:MAG: hypothetical protein ACLVME_07095 [Ezakiella coagulans]|uniref:hypothetical protein n=1 Tax=Ezakiella coagulans TaxID=46507 RepID=UPI00399A928E
MNINNNDKKISRIYNGGILVWRPPEVMYDISGFNIGEENLRFKTYPGSTDVEVKIYKNSGEEEDYKTRSTTIGLVLIMLKSSLKEGDSIDISFKKSGWADSFYSQFF